MRKNIFITCIILLATTLLLGGCGVIFPNIAKITVVVDAENTDVGFTKNEAKTYDIFDVYIEDAEDKKFDIKVGGEQLYEITWWGESQQQRHIFYYYKQKDATGETTKIYDSKKINVKNFDHIKFHILHDSSKSPEIEYVKPAVFQYKLEF